MYAMARYVTTQQGVNLCDNADPVVVAAKSFALTGTTDNSGTPILDSLTADMISIRLEQVDPTTGAVSECPCGVPGCDTANGGTPPDYVVISIPNGYPIVPRIPLVANTAIPLEAGRAPAVRWNMRSANQGGQATVEYAILTAGIIIPLVFGLIYLAQMLWIWHSVNELTRDGARYAATHCWQAGGANVVSYMRSHVPADGGSGSVPERHRRDGRSTYFSRDPELGFADRLLLRY